MLKIIGGKYRSRIIKTLDGQNTRPTSNMTKEAIFNIIAPYVLGASILDIFAGSGALGIEAISRGANNVTFIDNNKDAINIIKDNIKLLNIENVTIINDDYKIINSFNDKKFDIILLDPPYKMDVINEIIKIIDDNNLLNEHGIIIYESDGKYKIDENINYEIKIKKYGIAYVSILYKR